MNFRKFFAQTLSCCAALAAAVSCVKVNYTLGSSIIPKNETFITRTVTIPIDSILVRELDSLSGYSSQRMTAGAVRDELFGTTRRSTALSLVPMSDTICFGTNIHDVKFHCTIESDTTSYPSEDQKNIIQNIRVYPLFHALDSTFIYSCQLRNSDFRNSTPAVKGVPTYSGTGTLEFDFTDDFAWSYINEGGTVIIDTLGNYLKDHPGIYICTDDPLGYGGRLNFFKVGMDFDQDRVVYGNYALLSYTADFTDKDGKVRENVDTSIFFAFGATTTDSNASFYAFNCTEHESASMGMEGYAGEFIPIEGGAGLKPVLESSHLRNIVRKSVKDTLEKYGVDVENAFLSRDFTVNKATVYLPYVFPDNYKDMTYYPQVLNPTMRLSKKDTVAYAGLTDASISTENQGEIDRSLNVYHPDISHHLQQILATNPRTSGGRDSLKREDIWFLILATEVIETKNNNNSMNDYYSQMAYLNYYNSMLGGYGGYGSYGGYGGYGGYGYDNYYNYYMMQAMYSNMNSSSSSTTTSTTLDKDRFYKAFLCGPSAPKEYGRPRLTITYSFLKGEQ